MNENTARSPRIVTKQLRRLIRVASLDDQQNPTVVRVWTSQYDPSVFEQAIHIHRMLIPERLLTAWQTGNP